MGFGSIRALCNLDPYTFTDEVAEHFAAGDENNQQTAEEILAKALFETRDEKLTSYALRFALTGYIAIPLEGEFDFLAEVQAVFGSPQDTKREKPKKTPTSVKSATKKTATRKKLAG